MYDHNQTLVPDSFLALYVRNGRLTAERRQVEQRYDLAEDLALHIAQAPWMSAVDSASGQVEALQRCRAGLLTEPVQVTPAEAGWIVRRVAELHDWNGADLGIE